MLSGCDVDADSIKTQTQMRQPRKRARGTVRRAATSEPTPGKVPSANVLLSFLLLLSGPIATKSAHWGKRSPSSPQSWASYESYLTCLGQRLWQISMQRPEIQHGGLLHSTSFERCAHHQNSACTVASSLRLLSLTLCPCFSNER